MLSHFLEDAVTSINASDYGVGGYLYSVTNGKVRVIRFFSKAFVRAQLNWSTREKECYDIYFGVKTFEDLLDNWYFILKTDHINLTYLNVTLTGKVLRWKLYLQIKTFTYAMFPKRRCTSKFPMPFLGYAKNNMPSNHNNPIEQLSSLQLEVGSSPHFSSAEEQPLSPQAGAAQPDIVPPKKTIAKPIYKKNAKVHNSMEGHWGLNICKRRLNDNQRIHSSVSQLSRN